MAPHAVLNVDLLIIHNFSSKMAHHTVLLGPSISTQGLLFNVSIFTIDLGFILDTFEQFLLIRPPKKADQDPF